MRDELVLRVIRRVLSLLPTDARRDFAEEIEEVTRRKRHAMGAAPASRLVEFWIREVSAVAMAVIATWADLLRARSVVGGGTVRRFLSGLQAWAYDVRFAWRAVLRGRGTSAAVIATLAVGIGATLAVFSVIDAVLLDPIPVPASASVVRVFQASDGDVRYGGTAYPTLLDYRDAGSGLDGPVGFASMDVSIRAGEGTHRVSAGLVSGDYFEVLRIHATLGRAIRKGDDRPEAPAVAVVGYGLWLRLYSANPGVIGQTLEVNGSPFQIVGVAPKGFRGVTLESAPELWIPLNRVREAAGEGLYASPDILETRAFPWISMAARVRPGGSAEAGEARLGAMARRLRTGLGDASGLPDLESPILVRPLAESAVGDGRGGILRFLALLAAVVTLTLVVSCANAASLISARAAARGRELAVRQALGAGPIRVVRQLLLECGELALLGGLAGLGLALMATRALRGFELPGGIALDRLDLSLDGRLAIVALALSFASAMVAGPGPALAHRRGAVAARLRKNEFGGWARGGRAPVLIGLQVAVSVVLAVGALLFARTIREALRTELGWKPEGLAAVTVTFRGQGFPVTDIPGITDQLLTGITSSPVVASAALASHLPLAPSPLRLRPAPDGTPSSRGEVSIDINVVSPGYFETLSIPMVAGRSLDRTDTREAPRVAVLTKAAAEILWPEEAPLGRTLVLVRGLEPIEVVGIVSDHKVHGVNDERLPYIFVPIAQNPGLLAGRVNIVARTTSDPRDALAVVRHQLRTLVPFLPIEDARLVESQISRVLMPQRLGGLLLGFLASVALAVSAIGVYGTVAFAVRRRTREIGIRIALGAGPLRVIAGVTASAAAAVCVGLALGLSASLGLTRFLREYLFGVTALDPLSFLSSAVLMVLVAFVAAVLPARRAAALHPRKAMSEDG